MINGTKIINNNNLNYNKYKINAGENNDNHNDSKPPDKKKEKWKIIVKGRPMEITCNVRCCRTCNHEWSAKPKREPTEKHQEQLQYRMP